MTAIVVCSEELLVGTAWGCVVVAEASSMRPITVFRPFEADVRAIIPLSPPTQEDCVDQEEERGAYVPMVATIGKGYRNLLNRYAQIHKSHELEGDSQNSLFCLIWRAHQWINS